MKPSKIKPTAYNGPSIPVLGKCILKITSSSINYHNLFIVADTDSPLVLGLTTSEKHAFIKRIMEINLQDVPGNLVKLFGSFRDLGTLPQIYHIQLKPGITPVVHPPRRIPRALKPQFRDEHSRLEELGIIEKK